MIKLTTSDNVEKAALGILISKALPKFVPNSKDYTGFLKEILLFFWYIKFFYKEI